MKYHHPPTGSQYEESRAWITLWHPPKTWSSAKKQQNQPATQKLAGDFGSLPKVTSASLPTGKPDTNV